MSDSRFSAQSPIELKAVYLFKDDDTKFEDYNDITPFMDQFEIYEDIDSPTISAVMVVVDAFNLIDRLPILGGERIRIVFKTTSFENDRTQDFVIYRIGDRKFAQNFSKGQTYPLYLCTVDRYRDANMCVSIAYKNNWEEIVVKNLKKLATKKLIETDISLGIQNFISPYWTPLKVCSHAAKRAFNDNKSPFYFFETLQGYKFKALSTMYAATPVTKLYIEPKNLEANQNNPDKSLNTIVKYEYGEALDKLKNIASGALGLDYFVFDLNTMNVAKESYSYENAFPEQMAHLEPNKLLDINPGEKAIVSTIMSTNDQSHTARAAMQAARLLMYTFKVTVMIPGNSEIQAGDVVEMNIPAKGGDGIGMNENVTSGKWFISSLKHMIRKDSYYCVLTLCKDSTSKELTSTIK